MGRRFVLVELDADEPDPTEDPDQGGMALRTKAVIAALVLLLVLLHSCSGHSGTAPAAPATTAPTSHNH